MLTILIGIFDVRGYLRIVFWFIKQFVKQYNLQEKDGLKELNLSQDNISKRKMKYVYLKKQELNHHVKKVIHQNIHENSKIKKMAGF